MTPTLDFSTIDKIKARIVNEFCAARLDEHGTQKAKQIAQGRFDGACELFVIVTHAMTPAEVLGALRDRRAELDTYPLRHSKQMRPWREALGTALDPFFA